MKDFNFLNIHQNYALIGMNDDKDKFAYQIFFKLLENNKNVYGINPKYDVIDNHKIYSSISDINHPIDAVIFVVNPKIGIHYLEEIKDLGIQTIWLQPGSESEALINKAHLLNLNVIENCVLTLYAKHKKPTIKAVICDLDETLLNDDKKVSKENNKMIQKIRQNNIYFIPATGRPYYSLKDTLDELNLYDEDDYTISYNGGMIHQNKTDQSLKFHGLDYTQVKKLFDIGQKEKVTMHIYLEHSTYAFNLNEEEKNRIRNFPNLIDCKKDNIDFLKNKKILKILYQNLDLDYLASLENKVPDTLKEDLEISYSSNRYLEFNPKGVSKGLALKEVAEILNISIEEILTIGDNDNDLSMIKISGKSGAPSNAVESIKKEADYISPYDYTQSSVADIIKHFID